MDIVVGEVFIICIFVFFCIIVLEFYFFVGYGIIGYFFGEKFFFIDIFCCFVMKFGGFKYFMIVSFVGVDIKIIKVGSFVVCVGSGYDVLKGVDVDFLVIGEMSYYLVLRVI